MKAPKFTLPDQDNKHHSLDDYLGRWLIVYFYPKDDTPGCTKEACSLRDNKAVFEKLDVSLIGISKDSVASHKKFAEKYHLNFPLLSDPEHTVIEAYGAWGKKKFMGREFTGIIRNTVLINPQGEIQKEYKNVNPLLHAEELIRDLNALV